AHVAAGSGARESVAMSVSEKTELRFERIAEEHLPGILLIEQEAYPEPWTEGMFREEITHPRSQFVVVLIGGELIGYGGYWPLLDEAHITSVTIRDIHRGLGHGRRLLQHILETAKTNGVLAATLEVRESNVRARSLYESMGFLVTGRRRRYYPTTDEDALIMTKHLT
ncbi:MAG: ribosomal protein S18-alanine N-acetyltransferase, partial [Candidatus Hydrogenedentes bacterium]|nr:ribosomal protein S18-alanine N-acetyltransferase [Candidatus Hydrogenedentota bacterium]